MSVGRINARVVAWLAVAMLTAAAAAPVPVAYTMTFARDSADAPVLEVELTMRGDASGVTRLARPSQWAGQDSLWRSISDVRVAPPARLSLDTANRYLIRHVPGATLHVHYALAQDWPGLLRWPLYHRAVISPDYALFNGNNGMLIPDLPDGRRIALTVAWQHLPADWIVTTSFGDGVAQRALTSAGRLRNASFAAGSFRRALTAGLSLNVWTAGAWQFSDTAFAGTIERLWSAEHRFWNDSTSDTWFAVLLPLLQRGTIGGTAFTNGFVALADTASSLDAIGLVVSHELFHEWNGHTIRTASPEERYKWFSEGFTDYYADRASREAGLLSDSGYVGRVNGNIRSYHLSSALGSTRAQVERSYWSNAEYNRYPYLQGYLLALHLDGTLRARSGNRYGLDDLMRALYQRSRRRGGAVTDSLIIATAPARLRSVVATAIDAFIVRGASIPLDAGALHQCTAVDTVNVYPFDLGFDVDRSTRDHVISGVRAGGPADRAGVADGMKLRGWGWYNGDPLRSARLSVTDSATRVITYFPHGDGTVAIPQLAHCHSE